MPIQQGDRSSRNVRLPKAAPITTSGLSGIVRPMKRMLSVRVSAGLLALLGGWLAYTQNPQAPPANTLQKIKDDLYMIEGDGGNVAIYLTNDGVILVDDKFERDYNDIMTKVKSLTDAPVKYVLNTHHHADHSGSNQKLLITAEVISQRNARVNMVAAKQ